MGNSQPGRKRRAFDDESVTPEPQPKRQRLADHEGDTNNNSMDWSNTPSTSRASDELQANDTAGAPPRKKKRLKRLSKLLSFSSNKINEGADTATLKSHQSHHSLHSLGRMSKGIPDGHLEDSHSSSCSSLSRSAWPTPWLESIFLPEFPSKNTVNEKCFVITNEIGRGAFGRVCRAIAKKDVRGIYAMKIMEKSRILACNASDQVKREVSIQKQLGHYTFIARMFACWQNRSSLYCLLQYAVGSCGDLYAVWRDYGPFPEDTIRLFAAEIACTIDFMHRRGVIYRDLKLENIVVDADGHILLVDFGLAKSLVPGKETKTICGTLQYMAPEIAREESYGHWVDWWSMGVLLHVLFTNRYPYPNAEAKHHRDLRFIDYSTPPGCSRAMGSFFNRLLNASHLRRMCCFEVIHAHPFFEEIDFEAVEQRKFSPLASFPWFDRCPSCNSNRDSDGTSDDESLFEMFEEKYEFNDFDYFNDTCK